MSFGRDREALSRVTGWRAQSQKYTQATTRKKRSGGGGARWRDAYWPSENSIDSGRLIAVPYEIEVPLLDADQNLVIANGKPQSEKIVMNCFPFVEHRDATTKKTTICSAGPFRNYKDYAQKCRGCERYYREASREGRTFKPGPVSARTLYAFHFFNYGRFAYTEQIDSDGRPVRNQQTGEPYMEWRAIRRNEEKKYKDCLQVEGRLQHWAVGSAYHQALAAKEAASIGLNCLSCNARDSINTRGYVCPNCEAVMIDMEMTSMSSDDLQEYLSRNPECESCHTRVTPVEYSECDGCADKAMRATMFDVDLRIGRVQTGVGPNGSPQYGLNLDYTWPSEPLRLEDVLSEHQSEAPVLSEIYAPTPFDKQVELLGEVRAVGSKKTRNYGG